MYPFESNRCGNNRHGTRERVENTDAHSTARTYWNYHHSGFGKIGFQLFNKASDCYTTLRIFCQPYKILRWILTDDCQCNVRYFLSDKRKYILEKPADAVCIGRIIKSSH